jgi:hypothetical protein
MKHPILYLFWGDGCRIAKKKKKFLAMLREQYPELEMRFFEVWDHPQFTTLGDGPWRKPIKSKLPVCR